MSARPRSVLLAGNPNAGKTTLFNALTGARARTGNYPGVTVERRVGALTLGDGTKIDLVDLPGTYSLSARSPEEQVAVDAILPASPAAAPEAVVVVCDASALARHLYLALQVLETDLPVVVVANMMDEARAAGARIDLAGISDALGVEVVPVVARTGEGMDLVKAALGRALTAGRRSPRALELDEATERDVREVEATGASRARALWAILSVGDDELRGVSEPMRGAVAEVRARAERGGRSIDAEIIAARYAVIDSLTERFVSAKEGPRWTDRVDAVLTHPRAGILVFVVVMGALFQALFSGSEPLIGAIEQMVALIQDGARSLLPAGPLRELVVDGVIAGVGNVIVFVPQIAMLSLFIAVLEDTGYLARVAFVIDRIMSGVGLHGRAFVPLLSGFACAVPAVIATRTIESRRDRLVTMLALPLMSCSARLPVYTLVIAVALPAARPIPGIGLSVGAAALLAMYALSVTATLAAAAVIRRTIVPGPRPALVLELPPYRMPVLRNLVLATWDRTRSFLTDAGTTILAITIVLWAVLSYPRDPALEARFEAQRAETAALSEDERDARLAAIDAQNARARMEQSLGGWIGRTIEPAIAPLGFDWRIGVGLIASFAAREVLVSTLGIVYGVGEADEGNETLRDELRRATRPDGRPVFTPLVGVSLMVFFVLAAQCMSTLAVVRRESGSWTWPVLMLLYMNVLAYCASLAVYQLGMALGLG